MHNYQSSLHLPIMPVRHFAWQPAINLTAESTTKQPQQHCIDNQPTANTNLPTAYAFIKIALHLQQRTQRRWTGRHHSDQDEHDDARWTREYRDDEQVDTTLTKMNTMNTEMMRRSEHHHVEMIPMIQLEWEWTRWTRRWCVHTALWWNIFISKLFRNKLSK